LRLSTKPGNENRLLPTPPQIRSWQIQLRARWPIAVGSRRCGCLRALTDAREPLSHSVGSCAVHQLFDNLLTQRAIGLELRFAEKLLRCGLFGKGRIGTPVGINVGAQPGAQPRLDVENLALRSIGVADASQRIRLLHEGITTLAI